MASACGEYPLRLTTFASSPKGTPLCCAESFAATAKSRPLGEGGCDQREQTEGVSCRQVLTEGVRPCPKTQPICKKSYKFFLKKAVFPLTGLL
mgnify:CR=1 FL=1